jgi:hypothetical protein
MSSIYLNKFNYIPNYFIHANAALAACSRPSGRIFGRLPIPASRFTLWSILKPKPSPLLLTKIKVTGIIIL